MNQTFEPEIHGVLAEYDDSCRPTRIEPLGAAGGYSGARFWRLETPSGRLVLRCWPKEHPSTERLEFIQAVLWHLGQRGIDFVPIPLPARNRKGYVRFAGHTWELAPWMRGEANFHSDPRPARLTAAMRALAHLHVAAQTFPLPEQQPCAAPGMVDRLPLVEAFIHRDADLWTEALARQPQTALASQAASIVKLSRQAAASVRELLAEAAQLRSSVQPCLRDIWHDHVLFEGDMVSGIVDFGALRTDHIAADLARLIGSLVGDDADRWHYALDAYAKVRPLSADDRILVPAYDASGTLMAGWNWIRWLFLEGRQFENPAAVSQRLDGILQRLRLLTHPNR